MTSVSDKENRLLSITALRNSFTNTLAELLIYNFEPGFKWKILVHSLKEFLGKFGRVDFSDFTSDELLLCGFKIWDKESNLHLIPLYLYPFLPNGLELTCIDGTKKIVQENYTSQYVESSLVGIDKTNNIVNENYIDNDNRAGMLAFGIIPKEVL